MTMIKNNLGTIEEGFDSILNNSALLEKDEKIFIISDEFTKNQIIASHNGNLVSSWKAVQKLDFDLKEKSLAVV